MFERFTESARHVIVLAQVEARSLQHGYIGTEHLLLGLAGQHDGVAAQALARFDMDLESLRAEVVEIVGVGTETPSGHIPFTPRMKHVLELSLRESLERHDGYIGTEHMLLAILREGEGVAAQILTRLGADHDAIGAAATEVDAEEGPRRMPHHAVTSAGAGPAVSGWQSGHSSGNRVISAAASGIALLLSTGAAVMLGGGPDGLERVALGTLAAGACAVGVAATVRLLAREGRGARTERWSAVAAVALYAVTAVLVAIDALLS